jgi:acyl-CoA thioester hydrolase
MKMTNSMFTWRARVRGYECDALGHVNNAVYLHYLQQATTEAWPMLGADAWELRTLATEYLAPARSGDELAVTVWADGAGGGLPACEYAIARSNDAREVLRARATWALPRGEAGVLPAPDWPSAPAELPRTAPLRLSPDRPEAYRYRWRHTVCNYELDANGFANPVQLLRWVEEAKFVACAEVGWPISRMLDADLVIVQIRHDSQFHIRLQAGECVEIVSWICDLRLLKGTWTHEVNRLKPDPVPGTGGEDRVALDYSTGAFLNHAGRPQPAPRAFLDALLKGTGGG